ncbi:MAG: glycosyltransferase family 4 protein [Acidimicrobiia bacterium]
MAQVVVRSEDTVGEQMAGPAIRAWEFATRLASRHSVTLIVPQAASIATDAFEVAAEGGPVADAAMARADVVIAQQVNPAVMARARRARFVLDAYDPIPLEIIEHWRAADDRSPESTWPYWMSVEHLLFAFRNADAFLCASDNQRDLWTGVLLASGRLDPARYDDDPDLTRTVAVVPFGRPDEEPARTTTGPRSQFGLSPDDLVMLWGGGIWPWLDALTPMRAVQEAAARGVPVRLVFMGTKRPNDALSGMDMGSATRAAAQDLGLLDTHVFFNEGWVPYQDRASFLLDADVGVSAHFEHLETRFAFRTRMLDYLWAGLPTIATSGDWFADVVTRSGAGIAVPPNDASAFASAIVELHDPDRRASMSSRAVETGEQFTWEKVTAPLLDLVDDLASRGPRTSSAAVAGAALQARIALRAERALGVRSLVQKVKNKVL